MNLDECLKSEIKKYAVEKNLSKHEFGENDIEEIKRKLWQSEQFNWIIRETIENNLNDESS